MDHDRASRLRDPRAPVRPHSVAPMAMLAGTGRAIAGRVLAVFAHPDDETLAMGGQLPRLCGVRLMCVTDGAPLDRRHWPAGVTSRGAYADMRAAEFRSAMALAGVREDAVIHAGLTDLTVLDHAADLARQLAGLFRHHHISLVITHAYEGGHPDHDGTALAVHAAAALLARDGLSPPGIVDTALYRLRDGRAEFGASALGDWSALRLVLDDRTLDRKAQMLAAYQSQSSTLAQFDPAIEVFRNARRVDFSRLPNNGALLYGHFRFPLTPDDLLRRNQATLQSLGLAHAW